MRRTGYVFTALLLFGGSARAQTYGWQGDQDGNNFECYDAQSFSANNLTSGGPTFSVQSTGQIVNGNPFGSVTAWFVDPVAGVDSGACTTSATACNTFAEIRRRLQGATITSSVTVTLLGNAASSDTGQWDAYLAPGVRVTFLGTTGATTGYAGRAIDNTVHCGTVTAFAAAGVVPAADDIEMSDSGLPTSFTASGMLASGVIFFDTTTGNRWWWAAKDLGSKTIRISAPQDQNSGQTMASTLTVGDAYCAYQLWTMPAQNFGTMMIGTSNGLATVLRDRVMDNGTTSQPVGAKGIGYAVSDRRVWIAPTKNSLLIFSENNSVIEVASTDIVSFANQVPTNFGGMWKGNGSAVVVLFGQAGVGTPLIMQGVEMETNDYSYMSLEQGVAAFDLSIPALFAVSHSAIQFNGASFLSGKGNSSKLAFSDQSSQIDIGGGVSSNPAALPPFVAGSTSDGSPIQLGSTSYAVSAIPTTTNVAMSLSTQFPSTVFFKGTPYTQATFDTATANQCLALDATATKIQGVACGGGGAVSSVTGTAQRISATPTTGAVVVDTIGGYYSGAVTSGNEDLGTTLTNGLVCDTTTAGVAVLRTCAAGTDYVGSVAVTAPIVENGTSTAPNIGISLPASQVATGTGTNVTSSANLAWNGTQLAVGLPLSSVPSSAQAEFYLGRPGQADVNVVNDNAATNAQSAVRVCSGITCDATNSLLFSHLGHGWTVLSPLLGPGNAFIELEDSTSGANLGFSVYGNGDVVFTTTTSRTPRFYVKNAGNLEVATMTAPGTPASGELACWGDSTAKDWTCKNDAGTITHGMQTATCGANTFATATTAAGAVTCTQPTIGNLAAIPANTLVGNPTGSSAVPTAVTLGTCLNMTGGTSVDLNSGACGGTSTFGSGTTYVQSVTVDGYGKVQSASTASTLVCSLLPAVGGDLSSGGGTCGIQVIALEETSGPARLSINAIPDLGSGNAALLNRPGGTGTVVGTDSRALVVADELTYYVSYTLSVGGGYISTSSTTNLGTGTNIEYPTSHIALHATLCVNLIANGIITGNPIVNTNRNGSGIGGGSGVNFTSSTTPGVYCTSSFSTGSSSATDTYGVEQGNSATGTMTYTAHLVLN